MARILIVEDDFLIADATRRVLEGAGHEVVGEAPTAARARMLAASGHLDLAIVDMKLADGVDGLTLGAELAERHGCRILIATAYADWVVERSGSPSFACEVMHKPYAPDTLLAAVAKCLAA
jgi:DNA-binding response OmpR family regulator